MKRTKIIAIIGGIILLFVVNFYSNGVDDNVETNLLNFKIGATANAEDAACPWGYKSTTTWPGNCINCNCGTWNFTGKTTGCS